MTPMPSRRMVIQSAPSPRTTPCSFGPWNGTGLDPPVHLQPVRRLPDDLAFSQRDRHPGEQLGSERQGGGGGRRRRGSRGGWLGDAEAGSGLAQADRRRRGRHLPPRHAEHRRVFDAASLGKPGEGGPEALLAGLPSGEQLRRRQCAHHPPVDPVANGHAVERVRGGDADDQHRALRRLLPGGRGGVFTPVPHRQPFVLEPVRHDCPRQP